MLNYLSFAFAKILEACTDCLEKSIVAFFADCAEASLTKEVATSALSTGIDLIANAMVFSL
jgi:hypothetical protein